MTTFSTVGLPEAQRLERWESHNADVLIGLRCRTSGASPLEATETDLRLGRLRLARVRATAHVVERDAATVRRRPAESVAVFVSLAGEASFRDTGGVRTLRPGQLLVCDADRPFVRGFSRGLDELVVTVPREHDLPEPVVASLTAGSFGAALARLVAGAVRGQEPDRVDQPVLLALVAALLGRAGGADLLAAHRAAVETYVERHLGDPGLAAPQVAAAVGISTRHLSRVLAAAGTTLPQHVRARRLETARALLVGGTPASIAEVARRCGFTSPAHFSHAFTQRYGERAGEVRRAVAASRSGHDPQAPSTLSV